MMAAQKITPKELKRRQLELIMGGPTQTKVTIMDCDGEAVWLTVETEVIFDTDAIKAMEEGFEFQGVGSTGDGINATFYTRLEK